VPLPDRNIRIRVKVPHQGQWHLAGLVAEAARLPAVDAEALVEFGSCQIAAKVVRDPNLELQPGALLVVNYLSVPTSPPPRIRHRDKELIVVEKPAGIPVQPTPQGAGNSLIEQVAELTGASDLRVVHRLDVGVSGLLALARNRPSAAALTQAFSAGSIKKIYLAAPLPSQEGIVWLKGVDEGHTIDAPTRWVSRTRRTLIVADGKPSQTSILHATQQGEQWLLLLRLHTGRTHQIRAHLVHVGLPLLGDRKYGAPARAGRLGLHSISMSLPHPKTGKTIRFWAPPPDDYLQLTGIEWDQSCDEYWRLKTR